MPIVPCGWETVGFSPNARLVLCAARSDAHSRKGTVLSGVATVLDLPPLIFCRYEFGLGHL